MVMNFDFYFEKSISQVLYAKTTAPKVKFGVEIGLY